MHKIFRVMIFPGRNSWTCGLGFLVFFVAASLIRLWSGTGAWAAMGGLVAGFLAGAIIWRIESRHLA